MSNMVLSFVFVILCIPLVCSKIPFPVADEFLLLNQTDAESTITKSELCLLLVYKGDIPSDSQDVSKLLKEMEVAKPTLATHDVHFGVFDCEEAYVDQICDKKNEPSMLSVYLNGSYLTELPIGSMYDQPSIISGALQLLLLNEVPLFRIESDVFLYMRNFKKTDFLVLSIPYLGTQEHADFMVVAKQSQMLPIHFGCSVLPNIMNRYLTRKNPLVKDDSKAQLHIVKCKDSTVDDDTLCPVYQYAGRLDLKAISDVAFLLAKEPEYQQTVEMGIPTMSCFYDDNQEKELVDQLVKKISVDMMGMFGFYVNPRAGVNEKFIWLEERHRSMIVSFKGQGAGCLVLDPALHIETYLRYDLIESYLKDDVMKVKHSKVTKVQEKPTPTGLDALIQEIETQDDEVYIKDEQLGGREKLTLTNIAVLDRQSFNAETHDGLVLFHINKLDARSRMVSRLYNDAASAVPDMRMSAMDCYDWTDICRKLNINQFPTIQAFKNGERFNYTGPYSKDALVRLAKFSRFGAPHKVDGLTEMYRLRTFFEENKMSVIVGLFPDDSSKGLKAYKSAASLLYGQEVLTYSTGDFAQQVKDYFELKALPQILAYDPNVDPDKAITSYDKAQITARSIEDFALLATRPAFEEMTPESLPIIFRKARPQFLLFIEKTDDPLYDQILSLSSDVSLKNKYGFSYLLTKGNDRNWRILSKLASVKMAPSFVVVDYSKGQVFENLEFSVKNPTYEEIKIWLQHISIGKVTPARTLEKKQWKPTNLGYDFLDMIDKQNKQDGKPVGDFSRIRSVKEKTSVPVSTPDDVTTPAGPEATHGSKHIEL